MKAKEEETTITTEEVIKTEATITEETTTETATEIENLNFYEQKNMKKPFTRLI